MSVCDCSNGCQFDDQFQPATRELMVFTKAQKRYFDLDAVREPPNDQYRQNRHTASTFGPRSPDGVQQMSQRAGGEAVISNPSGAPPLDWWQIPSSKPQPVTEYEGDPMTATFYVGDAIETMGKLPEKSVDLVLTSPPFLALRSYLPADHPDKALEGGSQATPGEYVDWLLDVVEACARVLAPHGSLVFELGDTYSGSGGAGGDYSTDGLRDGQPKFRQAPTWGDGKWSTTAQSNRTSGSGKGDGWPLAKSLSLIPETFRFAMVYGHNPHTGRQTEPWRLRNVIRWVRPNPPVGALGDKFRPATSELMVFCKAKDRYFDLDATREPHKSDPTKFTGNGYEKGRPEGLGVGTISEPGNPAGAPPLDWWNIPPGGYSGAHYAVFPPELLVKPIKAMCPESVCRTCGEASRRIVSQTTRFVVDERQSLADEIAAKRQLLGVSRREMIGWFPHYKNGESVTAQISNWELAKNVPSPTDWEILKSRLGLSSVHDGLINGDRTWQRTSGLADYELHGEPVRQNAEDYAQAKMGQNPSAQGMPRGRATKIPKDAGFTDCEHNDYRSGLVLDPFAGSGTTGAVATGHGRDAVLIDLDERNYQLALDRVGPFILERGLL